MYDMMQLTCKRIFFSDIYKFEDISILFTYQTIINSFKIIRLVEDKIHIMYLRIDIGQVKCRE